MRTQGSFQVKSLREAGLTGGKTYTLLAWSDKYEIWAHRYRATPLHGQRTYHTTFSAKRVLSQDPRKFEDVTLPRNIWSDFDRVLAHLEKL